jgi:hypothetical protein
MGKEIVKCQECGKEYVFKLFGKIKDRENKVKNWRGLCETCNAKKCALATDANKKNGMADLKGSEKQVNWANQIRAKKMAVVTAAEILSNVKAERQALVQDVLTWLKTNNVASWWIDHRNFTANDLIALAEKTVRKK